MTMTLKRLYGAFSKITKNDDGTLEVEGIASSEAVDSDGEIIKADAMKAAIPGYMKFGAVREMHASIAAGTALSIDVDDAGMTHLKAHIVDPVSVKKVETKVLKGFSIGGKVTGRDTVNKSTIVGLDLVEISLVDRPANPDAIITCFKAEGFEPAGAETGKTSTESGNSATEVVDPATKAGKTGVIDPEVAAVDALAEHMNKGEVSATLLLELIAKHKAANAPIRKGLYGVAVFADTLCCIGSLAANAQNEADWEGDNSPVPAALRGWVAAGAKILQDMTAEECNELLASLKEQAGEVDIVEMAARAGADLTKAGAKFSAKSKEVLGDVHKAMGTAQVALQKHADSMKDCCDKMDSLGYATAEEPAGEKNAAAAVTPAEPVAESAPAIEKTIDIANPNLSMGELILGTVHKAVVPAPVETAVAVVTPKPVLMVVDKSGTSTPLGAAPAAAGAQDNETLIKNSLRTALGLPF
jgi:hypothetical protein